MRPDRAAGGDGVLDRAFIAEHTTGFEALVADLAATSWDAIERRSGLTRARDRGRRERLREGSKRVILCYGMGVTQHRHGTGERAADRQPAAAARQHRAARAPASARCAVTPTCRATAPSASPRSRTRRCWTASTDVRLRAAARARATTRSRRSRPWRTARSKALVCLGGNLRGRDVGPAGHALPRMRKLDLAVHIATKLNRSHLLLAATVLHPAVPRPHRDRRCRRAARNRSRSRIRCRWCTPRAAA